MVGIGVWGEGSLLPYSLTPSLSSASPFCGIFGKEKLKCYQNSSSQERVEGINKTYDLVRCVVGTYTHTRTFTFIVLNSLLGHGHRSLHSGAAATTAAALLRI